MQNTSHLAKMIIRSLTWSFRCFSVLKIKRIIQLEIDIDPSVLTSTLIITGYKKWSIDYRFIWNRRTIGMNISGLLPGMPYYVEIGDTLQLNVQEPVGGVLNITDNSTSIPTIANPCPNVTDRTVSSFQ